MMVLTKKIGEFYRELVSLELKRRLNACSDVLFLNYHKLSSTDMTQLRKNLKAAGASVLVTKNSFIKKILEDEKKPTAAVSLVEGQTALVFVKEDPIAVSKVLVRFAKDHEALQIRGGFLSDLAITSENVKTISKLGSRQSLYQQVASALNAPIGKLAISLNQIIAKLAYALKAVSEKKK